MIDGEPPAGAIPEEVAKPKVKPKSTEDLETGVKMEDGKHDEKSPFPTDLPEGIEVTKVSVPVKPVTADDVLTELKKTGGMLKRAGWRTSETTGAASQTGENAGATPTTPPVTPLKK